MNLFKTNIKNTLRSELQDVDQLFGTKLTAKEKQQ